MAKMAVDRLVEREARDAPCRTHVIPLGAPVDAATLPRVEGLPEAAYAALAARYGHVARDVLVAAAQREELARPIVADLPDTLAEAVHAVRHEQANHLGDVLLRRTRLGLLAARDVEAGGEAARRVVEAMGRELEWDEARQTAELEGWRLEATAEAVLADP
jgi:glycerol-3-phosphate dehydrogenase